MDAEDGWERAFLAVSLILGEPIDVAVRALGGKRPSVVGSGPWARDRRVRARWIADVLVELVRAVEARRIA